MKYKVSFEFETDEPLRNPLVAVERVLDNEFDNLKNIKVKKVI